MKPLRPPANESKEAVALRVAASDEIVGEALKRRVLAAVESFALQRKAAAARNGRKGGRAVRGGGS